MQKAYITALYELALKDNCVYSVLSDSGTEYDELFARDFPGRCINVGIAEENQVGIAAGLAKAGKIPFVYTSGAFLAYRAFEFIRDDICLQNRNVKIVGMGSGLSWSTLGPTHHTTEDVGVLRSLPGISIFSPSTPVQAAWCVRAAYEIEGPVYLRLGMGGEPELYEGSDGFEAGKPCVFCDGDAATIFSTGPILRQVVQAADFLRSQGVHIRVVDVHTLKPVEAATLMELMLGGAPVFSVEEHNVIGGLGSIVAEAIACAGCRKEIPFLYRLGLQDCFASGYGTYDEVRHANGLDAESLARRIKAVL